MDQQTAGAVAWTNNRSVLAAFSTSSYVASDRPPLRLSGCGQAVAREDRADLFVADDGGERGEVDAARCARAVVVTSAAPQQPASAAGPNRLP